MPKKGDRVFHQKFGYGKIINVDGEKLEIKLYKYLYEINNNLLLKKCNGSSK